MAYQTTTKKSYGQNLTGSLKGIKSGLILFLIGTVALFWNEGNFVKTKKSLQEAEGNVVRVADVSAVDLALNGKLIHASATAESRDVLTDGLFGVSETAIAIGRKVEFYQWKESSRSEAKEKIGGGTETVTSYTYDKQWTSAPVASASFQDPAYKSSNFVLVSVEDRLEYAQNVDFGGYRLPGFIISRIGGDVPVQANLPADKLAQWEAQIAGNRAALGLPAEAAAARVHALGSTVYFGKSPASPAVGDVRVTLFKIPSANISIIARVAGSTFEPYIASNGRAFSSVAMGTVSADTMFTREHSANSTITWLLRLIGILLVVGGLRAMFSILPTLFKVLPFLGKVVGAGTKLVCAVLGGAWSLIIIAVAWLWYRPLIGVALLAVAVAGVWYLKSRGEKTPAAPAAPNA